MASADVALSALSAVSQATEKPKIKTKVFSYCTVSKCNLDYGQTRKEGAVSNAPSDPKQLAPWDRAMSKTYLELCSTKDGRYLKYKYLKYVFGILGYFVFITC